MEFDEQFNDPAARTGLLNSRKRGPRREVPRSRTVADHMAVAAPETLGGTSHEALGDRLGASALLGGGAPMHWSHGGARRARFIAHGGQAAGARLTAAARTPRAASTAPGAGLRFIGASMGEGFDADGGASSLIGAGVDQHFAFGGRAGGPHASRDGFQSDAALLAGGARMRWHWEPTYEGLCGGGLVEGFRQPGDAALLAGGAAMRWQYMEEFGGRRPAWARTEGCCGSPMGIMSYGDI